MRVLLIQGYLGPSPPDSLVYPLGLAYVATALAEDGHDVRVCDPNAIADERDHIRRVLREFDPEVVGLSLRNIDTTDFLRHRYYYGYLSQTLNEIRCVCPTVPLIVGGTGFSTFPEKIMREHSAIDFGVYLEGEATAVELLRNLGNPSEVLGLYYRCGESVVFTGLRAFAAYPNMRWPRRDFVDLEPYLATERSIGVQSYRGCPLRCAYCNYPSLNGRKLRGRTASDVVDEIEHLHRKHGVREIIFTDSLFDLQRPFAVAICEELIARHLDLRWSAWFETYKFDEEWFLLARRAGCYRFCFSPDGATDRTMKALGKRCRVDDVAAVVRIAERYPGTAFRFTLFCGVTGQDWHDVWMSLLFMFRTHFLLENSRCLLSWIRLFPNSDIYRQLATSGNLPEATDLLPATVKDRRSLFFIAPDAPRLATPIMCAAFYLIDALRLLRRRSAGLFPSRGGKAGSSNPEGPAPATVSI